MTAQNPREKGKLPRSGGGSPSPSPYLPAYTKTAPVSTGGSCSYFDIIFPTTTTSCCHVSFVGRVASIGQEKNVRVSCAEQASLIYDRFGLCTLCIVLQPDQWVSAASTSVSAPHNAHAEFKPLEWLNESTTQMSRMTNSWVHFTEDHWVEWMNEGRRNKVRECVWAGRVDGSFHVLVEDIAPDRKGWVSEVCDDQWSINSGV